MLRDLILLFLLLFAGEVISADALRDYLEAQTRYWGIHEAMTATDMDKLVELKQKADRAGLTTEERTKAYEDLFQFVQKLRAIPIGKVPSAMAAGFWSEEQSRIPSPNHVAKPGELANFTKRGTGSISMILIPDLGGDWSVFDSYMQRNQERFTLYAVTLPGFGGSAPPVRPEKLDFAKREWWNNAEAAILRLMAEQKINRPYILGHQAGAYLAMRLALNRPQLVRGAIVLNGLLYAPVAGIPQNATASERARIVNSWTPVELFPNPSESMYRGFMLQFSAWNCKNKQRQESLAVLAAKSGSHAWWNYFAELATTDLSAEIKAVKLPMLVLPSIHDPESPGFETSKVTLEQWKGLDHSTSSLPITVVPIEDCRGYATEDQPAKLDAAIRNWTAKSQDSR